MASVWNRYVSPWSRGPAEDGATVRDVLASYPGVVGLVRCGPDGAILSRGDDAADDNDRFLPLSAALEAGSHYAVVIQEPQMALWQQTVSELQRTRQENAQMHRTLAELGAAHRTLQEKVAAQERSGGASPLSRQRSNGSDIAAVVDSDRLEYLERGMTFLFKVLSKHYKVDPSAKDFNLKRFAREDVPLCCEILKSNPSCTALDASYLELDASFAEPFARVLLENSTLESMDLSGNNLGPEGGGIIGEALAKNSTLISLNMHKNGLLDEGVAHIMKALENPSSALQALVLSANSIGSTGLKSLSSSLSVNQSLHSLSLGRNADILPEDLDVLCECLRDNTSLHQLSLQDIKFGDRGLQPIASLLKESHAIKELHIGGNKLGPSSGVLLAEALRVNRELEALIMFNNAIGEVGGSAIADSLRQNKKLDTLDLRYNEIGSATAQKLLDSLTTNPRLQILELHGNSIPDEARKSLATVMRQRSTKQEVVVEAAVSGDTPRPKYRRLRSLMFRSNAQPGGFVRTPYMALDSPLSP